MNVEASLAFYLAARKLTKRAHEPQPQKVRAGRGEDAMGGDATEKLP